MTDENKKNEGKQATGEPGESGESSQKNVFEEFGEQVGKFATKTMDSIRQSIDRAMEARNTVLTIRVNEEANKRMGMLVDTGIFKSRSESAAFLIEEGIKHQEALFKKIADKLEQIGKLKDELKTIVSDELDDTGKKKKK